MSLWVPDGGRAAAFFSSVLGWTYDASGDPQHRQVAGQSLHHGIQGAQPRSNLLMCLAVADLDAALERVVAAGGRAGEPDLEPFGRVALCADDQGAPLAL